MTRPQQEKLKRMLDVAASGAAMIVLSPIFGLVALLIRIHMGGPVMFRHTRPGYKGKPFTVLKFRTLIPAHDARGRLLSDSARLTPLGRTLRRWSLDELPQLWNVFKGDMSLVGPRPLMMEYLQRYTSAQARRHDVKPGLTGWAQLHGRQDLLFSKRLEMDVWYVDHWNVALDLKLIFLTLLRLHKLSAVGASLDVAKTDDLGLLALLPKSGTRGESVALSRAEG